MFLRLEIDLGGLLRIKKKFLPFLPGITLYATLRSLASALSNMHELKLRDNYYISYRHDIRPANILVGAAKNSATTAQPPATADAQWTFYLADFELGNLKKEQGTSKKEEKKREKKSHFGRETTGITKGPRLDPRLR